MSSDKKFENIELSKPIKPSSSNLSIKTSAKDNLKMNLNENDDDNMEEESLWWSIPEPVLLQIFSYLKPKDILSAGQCCKRWYQISYDDFLWKKLLHRDFRIDSNIGLKPGLY